MKTVSKSSCLREVSVLDNINQPWYPVNGYKANANASSA